jgi:protein-glucosylgalactosylhydroxylysine glucosidase
VTFESKAEMDEGWILEADDSETYAPMELAYAPMELAYAPLTLANGTMGRVPSRHPLHVDRVVLNRVYDAYGPDGVPRILPGIRFADLDLALDGEAASSPADVEDWHQRFDMRTAQLTTTFAVDDRVRVAHHIAALRHLPNVALVTLTVTAREAVALTIRHQMAVPEVLKPRAQHARDYREVPGPVFSCEARSPGGRHRIGAAVTATFDREVGAPVTARPSDRAQTAQWTVDLDAGETVRLDLIGAVCTTAEVSDPLHEAERLSIFARFEGRERLMRQHVAAWSELWAGDVVIEGDPEAQRDVRFALYNLYAYVRAGSRRSIPPMGLSAMGYNGHIFWDAELWMVPPLFALQPDLAQSCLDYRVDRLDAARRKAAAHGFDGAMFPWESADTGEEATPVWALTGTSEHHITACVAIAFWNYYRVTGDAAWLRSQGYPVLREAADFWVSRAERDETGAYAIRNVVGADEYTGVVDNNAFTNGAAITALRAATRAAAVLGLDPDPRWAEVAGGIPILTFPDGTTREYAGYDGGVVKQADANLLAYPLALITDDARIRQDMDFYESRFDEDAPAMTHSVLATLAARLGDAERAHALFKRAYRPNRKPPFGVLTETPFSDNPYFATAAVGMLQAVLFGFGGLRFTEDGLVQRSPCLPPGWTGLILKGVGPDRTTYTVKRR